ncbi:MAG: hypothetical protein P1U75_04995, partial [Antarcticimicrobium sp.]|uniref:hypothetical protein n=1 Tax=Antarcticimicrobium sp. TaxID=2824147 RepID=UPI00260A8AB3
MTDPILPEVSTDETPPPLPGFDAAAYLALNKDVAARPGVDAARHYRDHGRAELRTLLPQGGRLDHPASRALDPAGRAHWQEVLRTADTPLADLIADHPRAAWLHTGFTLAGYLQQCP